MYVCTMNIVFAFFDQVREPKILQFCEEVTSNAQYTVCSSEKELLPVLSIPYVVKYTMLDLTTSCMCVSQAWIRMEVTVIDLGTHVHRRHSLHPTDSTGVSANYQHDLLRCQFWREWQDKCACPLCRLIHERKLEIKSSRIGNTPCIILYLCHDQCHQ